MFKVIILFGVILALLFIFLINKKELKIVHSKRMIDIVQTMIIHKDQMTIRKQGLDLYDFRKYNINESLIVQKTICIDFN